MKQMKKQKGITLVALVITIIILLILSGITINSLTGSGLFEKAKLAKEKSENAEKLENTTLGKYENEIVKYINGTRNNLETTVLYPDGSETNPPTISVGQRIEVDNPYKGKNVYTRVELNINGLWSATDFTHLQGYGGVGIIANQVRGVDKDVIAIQAGSFRVIYGGGSLDGHGFPSIDREYDSAPYRLIVIKLD